MARFTTLYSGSSGNAGVVEENGKFLLIDMGHSCRASIRAMAELGLDPANLAAILVTHEHSDHISGLKVFLKKYPVRLFSGIATLGALWNMEAVPEETELVPVNGREEQIAGFTITGFDTSHDCAGCCGFRIQTPSGAQMAIATDLGKMTVEVFDHLRLCSLVALESNYDREMLRTGPYPAMLKRRVASPHGHLSNDACAATVAQLVAGGCKGIALCHLSETNNLPRLALEAVDNALFEAGVNKPEGCTIQAMPRYLPGEWMHF